MRALDHIRFAVADCAKSKAFYDQALAPLRMTLLMEFSGAAAGFGRRNGEPPAFFIEAYGEPAARGRLHIALRAESRSHAS
jgi:catechol 2,3-dioxygenase-like lactoylglutathione lyase family enzyme